MNVVWVCPKKFLDWSYLNRIPVAKPHMPNSDDTYKYMKQIDATKIYTNFGPLVLELEARIAQHLDVDPNLVASVSNATSGISGLIATAFHDSNVIACPSWTFTATPAAILAAGKKINFSDVSQETWEAPYQPNVAAIHVFPFGSTGHTNFGDSGLNEKIIIDAAASFGQVQNLNTPKKGTWAVVISMHATKIFGSGEGGFVFSNDKEWVASFKRWTNFGFWGSRISHFAGTNSKLSEYHAAVGLASFDKWQETANKYRSLTLKCKQISDSYDYQVHPAMAHNEISPYWILRLPSPRHKQLMEKFLTDDKIEFRDWWGAGSHTMPAYLNASASSSLTNTEYLAQVTIGLPFFIGLGNSQLSRIKRVFEQVHNEC